VIRIAAQVLDVLAYLHGQGVVHRDVKPSNLLLDAQDAVRLADLGLARPLEDVQDLTRTNMSVGTPAYMSPEQVRGEPPAPASDLYGLGITLYQLLTGRLPFAGKSNYEIARQHLATAVKDPRELRPDCPRWLARFVLRLLEKRPGDRWPDAGAARRAFGLRVGLTSPRVRRRALATAGVAASLAVIWLIGMKVVYPRVRRGLTVKVEAVGKAVRGLDARGRETWRLALGGPVQRVLRGDLDGDGKPETIVAAYDHGLGREGTAMAPSDVVAVRDDGSVVTRVHPEDLGPANWPFLYPRLFLPDPRLLDLDGDGRFELAVLCPQRGFFPFALLLYWPRQDVWDCVLHHSGWLTDVAAVPGAAPPRLRVAGVNNRLGMLPVAAEVVVVPPGSAPVTASSASLGSPEGGWSAAGRFSYAWYTPLPEGPLPTSVKVEPDGSSLVGWEGGSVRVDRLGNPVPGPNAGRDVRAERGRFLMKLALVSGAGREVDAPGVEERVRKLTLEYAELLAESPYRTLLGLAYGRALARVGDVEGGLRELRRTAADVPGEDVSFRLAQLEALGGDFDGATRLLLPMLDHPLTPRGQYDAVHLLIRIAIERRDEALVRTASLSIGDRLGYSSEQVSGLTSTLWARAHLWWDTLSESDLSARSWGYAPEGEALACLGRWRLGRTLQGDADAMRLFVQRNPDAAWEGQAALAAALLGTGHPADALASLERTVAGLGPESLDDFENRQVLDLVRALHSKALAVAGSRAAAAAEATRLRPTLRAGLLPRILVDDVLRQREEGSR
jgi:hypothetical protein